MKSEKEKIQEALEEAVIDWIYKKADEEIRKARK